MKVLVHCCCAPCSIYPFTSLSDRHIKFTPYFFNPNIHPYKEFKQRLDTFRSYCFSIGFKPILEEKYGLHNFLNSVFNDISNRCTTCYYIRIEETILTAKKLDFDFFTTTLLYSKYQNHQKIIEICTQLAIKHDVSFYYEDFRTGWDLGVQQSKDLAMYRQPYCGCIFSEQERYDKSLRKKSR